LEVVFFTAIAFPAILHNPVDVAIFSLIQPHWETKNDKQLTKMVRIPFSARVLFPPVSLIFRIFLSKEIAGSPRFASYLFENMPCSQTPAVIL